jgi:hypothetical protein
MLLPVRLLQTPYRVARPHVRVFDTLITMSNRGDSLIAKWEDPNTALKADDVPLAREFVYAFPNASSFHILLHIRRLDLASYSEIPDLIKANIVVGGLSLARQSDDWGDVNDVNSLGEAGSSLLAVSKMAAPLLLELLDDETRIGSAYGEVQASADHTRTRRKDIAYKYMCIILGRRPSYDDDPRARDEAIEKLKEEFAKKRD